MEEFGALIFGTLLGAIATAWVPTIVLPEQWETAVKVCEPNGGASFISEGFLDDTIRCSNGAKFKYSDQGHKTK